MKTFAALIAFCVASIAAASPAETVAARFVEVLRRDVPGEATRFMIADAPNPTWIELRDLVSRFDCINVLRYDVTLVSEENDKLTIRVDLVGSAELKADWRPRRPLAKTWHIEARRVDGEWRATRVLTEARRVGLAMFQAPSEAEAERILLEASHVDPRDVIPHYASALEYARIPRRLERVEHAADMARRFADESTEIVALRKSLDRLSQAHDPRALEVAQRTESLAREAGSKDDLAWAFLTNGFVRLRMQGTAPAFETYSRCTAMAGELDDPTIAIKCAQMQFHTASYVGIMSTLAPISRIEELSGRYRWEEGEELVLVDRTIVHSEFGDEESVRADMIELIELLERNGNRRSIGEAMYNLATHELATERYAEAAKLLRAHLARFGKSGNESLVYGALTSALIGTGELDEAEEALRQAEMIESAPDQCAAIRYRRGRIYLKRGQPHLAIAEANAALQTLDATRSPDEFAVVVEALAFRARAFRAAGRLADAETDLWHVIEFAESRREEIGGDALTRAIVQQSYASAYVELAEILVERQRVDEALRIAEQMKAGGLRHVIGGARIDPSSAMSAEEREREDALGKKVIALNRELIHARQSMQPFEILEEKLDHARRELDVFRTEMRMKHPTVARRRADHATPSLQMPASNSIAVIEYVVAETQVLAFVVTGETIRVERLPLTQEALSRDAREIAQLVATRSPAYAATAKRLHASLLAPLEKHLRGAKVLAILPDGALWIVPFHALIAADGKHVIDQRSVFYAHSLSLLNNATSTPRTAASQLLALGNPSIGATTKATLRSADRDTGLGSLEAAEAEVRTLAEMYTPQRSRVLYRDQAKEVVFKNEAPRYGILHLAAHAIVDDRAPMYSAVVLAPSGEASDDGLLEAREVVELSLNAELAVLSACETAGGKVRRGEGMIGLPWAFFAAGVPTTIVSQWDAESSATAKLMVEMHRNLLAGETIADALRAAQLSVRREARYRHPFYWAPFVAIGAAGRGLTPEP